MNQLDYELGILFVIVASAIILYNQFLAIHMVWVAMFFHLCVYCGSLAFALIASVRLLGTTGRTKSRGLKVPVLYIIRSKIEIILDRIRRPRSNENNIT
jgi:hypothetical protein